MAERVKEYAVKASGHGSAYTFSESTEKPIKLLTKAEAFAQARRWESHADTIGGRAIVVHMPTGTEVHTMDFTLGEMSQELGIWDQTVGCDACHTAWWAENAVGEPEEMQWHRPWCPLLARQDVYEAWNGPA